MQNIPSKIRLATTMILLITSFPFFTNVSFAAPTEQLIFHHPDHLSGASVDTDSNGTIIESVDYYPYGEIRVDAKTTTYENKHKFTGKELDESDNLYYYGARYYDPAMGRFISADPVDGDLTNPQSFNKYSYVLNNPLKYVDPTGKSAESILQWSWTTGGFASQFDGPIPGLADLVGLGIGIIGTVAAGGAAIYELVTDNHEIKKDVQVGIDDAAKNIAGGNTAGPSGMNPKKDEDENKNFKNEIKTKIEKFFKKAPKESEKFSIEKIKDFTKGKYEVPGKAGGQSKAVYNKIINSIGKTIKVFKDSYDKSGKFIHRKIKFP